MKRNPTKRRRSVRGCRRAGPLFGSATPQHSPEQPWPHPVQPGLQRSDMPKWLPPELQMLRGRLQRVLQHGRAARVQPL